jgi:pimeloyl-ACP methyl ester carboxylesterase
MLTRLERLGRGLVLAGLSALVGLVGPDAAAGSQDRGWQATDCRTFKLTVPADAAVDCGYVVVPLRHADPGGATIQLATVVLHADAADRRPDPLFVAQGGPGGSTIDSFGQLLLDSPEHRPSRNRDLVLWDQRGTLYSRPALVCTEVVQADIQASLVDAPPTDGDPEIGGYAACGERLAREAGDLSAFNSVENADDVEAVRQALGYDRIDFYGVSYGSELGQFVMRQHPDHLRRVVLDAVVPTSFNLLTDVAFVQQRIAEKYFLDCANDRACNAAYPDLGRRFLALVDRLDRAPVPARVLDPEHTERAYTINVTGASLESGLYSSLYSASMHDLVPYVVDRADQGDVSFVANSLIATSLFDTTQADGMYMSVVCAERGDTDPGRVDYSKLNPRLAQSALGDAQSILAICRRWGIRLLPRSVLEPVSSDIPTLLLSGDFDPITPPGLAEAVARHLPNSVQVVFPSGAHGQAFTSPCANGIIQRFLDQPGPAPEVGCAAVPPGRFLTPRDVLPVPLVRQVFAYGPGGLGATVVPVLAEAVPLAIGLLVLATALVVYPVGGLVRLLGRRRLAWTAGGWARAWSRLAPGLALVEALVGVGFVVGFARALVRVGSRNEFLLLMGLFPSTERWLFVLPVLAVVLAVAMLVAAVALWLGRERSPVGRVYYTVLVLAAWSCVAGLARLDVLTTMFG